MKKNILFIILLLVVLSLPIAVLADNPYAGGDVQDPTAGSSVTVGDIVHAAEKTALLIASGVVVILWVVTGLLFLMAQGAPDKLNAAKKALFAAVAGTVLVIVAGSAIALISNAFNIPVPSSGS